MCTRILQLWALLNSSHKGEVEPGLGRQNFLFLPALMGIFWHERSMQLYYLPNSGGSLSCKRHLLKSACTIPNIHLLYWKLMEVDFKLRMCLHQDVNVHGIYQLVFCHFYCFWEACVYPSFVCWNIMTSASHKESVPVPELIYHKSRWAEITQ